MERQQLELILDTLDRFYTFHPGAEKTLECNPDDLSPAYLDFLYEKDFNRLSIGIQSFHERDLELMRRSHDSKQAREAVKKARQAGFENISIDLIYGIPGQSTGEWLENLDRAIELEPDHISAYHLSFETGTVFDHWKQKGRIVPVPEEKSLELYRLLKTKMREAGYEHYEISNFGKTGRFSRHNQIYWSGENYLGFGPSAHSYDGSRRSWNLATLKKYIEGEGDVKAISESEELTIREQYHDYLITSFRTSRGIDPEEIEQRFGEVYRSDFQKKAEKYLKDGELQEHEKGIRINPDQWLISDYVIRNLFMD